MGSKAVLFPVLAAVSAGTFSVRAATEAVDSVNPLREVVVTGTNRATARDLLPYTVSVVGADELASTAEPQLLSAISGMVPSLFVTERSVLGFGVSNGGSGHIKLRGVGGDRASGVLMLLDGQPQFAGIYSHHVADIYGKEYVERVEVLRGPGSVLYGSNAMAGAINVITRDAGHNDGVRTTLSAEYGSYNTLLTTATNTVRIGRFSSLASLSYNRTDGERDDLYFSQWDGYAKLGWDVSERWRSYVDFSLMHFNDRDPVYATLSDPNSTDIYRQSVTRGEASGVITNSYTSTGGTARVYYSWGSHFIDDPRHFHSTDGRVGVLAYQNVRLPSSAWLTLGFDFDHYYGRIPVSGGTSGNPGTIDRKEVNEYSPYMTVSQPLWHERVTISGGLRLAMSDMFSHRWVPQAGVSVLPGAGFTLKANAAMGYRNPSFRELYLYKPANPDLEPERMWNYEVSVARDFGCLLSATLTAYFCRGTNLIQTVDQHNENTGVFRNKGIELTASSRPWRDLRLAASYSYLHTSLDNLTGAPRHQYFMSADWTGVKKLTVSASVRGVGRLYVALDYDYQSYTTLDLKAAYAVLPWLSLSLRAENLTDARYTINRGYPMPGVTVLGGLRLSI